jgi:ribosomal protein L2
MTVENGQRLTWSSASLPIDAIQVGTVILNIELKPGKGAQMVRTAAQVPADG